MGNYAEVIILFSAAIFSLLFMFRRYQIQKMQNSDFDFSKIIREIIYTHGFASNHVTGFSCYIRDRSPFPDSEGLLIWNYSNAHSRIETQFQKFFAGQRIYRMQEMLGLDENTYKKEFTPRIIKYFEVLESSGYFVKVGKGIEMPDGTRIFNMGAPFSDVSRNVNFVKFLEEITINNSITKFCEESGYFKVEQRDTIVADKLLNQNPGN